jgi:hypothetical protein
MIYDWVLVLILVPGPVPNSNVEVISQHRTKQQCIKAQGTKKNHICLPKDYN